MTYKIDGLPVGWAAAPPLVIAWLQQLRIEGEKNKNKICFKIEKVKEGLKKLKVSHVADFLEDKDLEFLETSCTEQQN